MSYTLSGDALSRRNRGDQLERGGLHADVVVRTRYAIRLLLAATSTLWVRRGRRHASTGSPSRCLVVPVNQRAVGGAIVGRPLDRRPCEPRCRVVPPTTCHQPDPLCHWTASPTCSSHTPSIVARGGWRARCRQRVLPGGGGRLGLGVVPGCVHAADRGIELFLLISGVDMTLGPLLSGVVLRPAKAFAGSGAICGHRHPAARRTRLWRPRSGGRTARRSYSKSTGSGDLPGGVVTDELASAPVQSRDLSWSGPRLTAAGGYGRRKIRGDEEGLAGFDVRQRPSFGSLRGESLIPYRNVPTGREADEATHCRASRSGGARLQEIGLAIAPRASCRCRPGDLVGSCGLMQRDAPS